MRSKGHQPVRPQSCARTKRLGVSQQRAQQLDCRDDLPAPYPELTLGSMWPASEVELWTRRYGWSPVERGVDQQRVTPGQEVAPDGRPCSDRIDMYMVRRHRPGGGR
jgi:hypothetical protein